MKQQVTNTRTSRSPAPTQSQREVGKTRILKAVSSWLETRIDEVFGMADNPRSPGSGSEIGWHNVTAVREEICGCLADDLEDALGECVQEILEGVAATSCPKNTNEGPERFVVIVLDHADSTCLELIVEAANEDEAAKKAVQIRKINSGLDDETDEGAGFEAVLVFTQEYLEWRLRNSVDEPES